MAQAVKSARESDLLNWVQALDAFSACAGRRRARTKLARNRNVNFKTGPRLGVILGKHRRALAAVFIDPVSGAIEWARFRAQALSALHEPFCAACSQTPFPATFSTTFSTPLMLGEMPGVRRCERRPPVVLRCHVACQDGGDGLSLEAMGADWPVIAPRGLVEGVLLAKPSRGTQIALVSLQKRAGSRKHPASNDQHSGLSNQHIAKSTQRSAFRIKHVARSSGSASRTGSRAFVRGLSCALCRAHARFCKDMEHLGDGAASSRRRATDPNPLVRGRAP